METRPLPFLAVGRVADAKPLAHYSVLETEEQVRQVRKIFSKLLAAAPKKLGKGERTRLQWNEGSICCVTGLNGLFFYCVFTANLNYPEALAYRLLYDMTVAVSELEDAEHAPADGLNEKLNPQMQQLVELYEAKSSVKDLQLNGSWSSTRRPDTIKNIAGNSTGEGVTLTWANGDATPLRIINSRSFEVTQADATHSAELKDDDKIHWSDGDVWFRREVQLTGAWSNASNPKSLKSIDGETMSLIWANGEVTPLEVTSGRKIKFERNGKSHSGELRDDDKIYWEDKDIWFHRNAEPTRRAETALSLPQQLFGISLW